LGRLSRSGTLKIKHKFGRWPSRLVATAEEDRLNIRHNTDLGCGGAIYGYAP